MKPTTWYLMAATVTGMLLASPAFATNPLIMDQFTADPTARVFEGKIYMYPSHDIKAPPGYKGRPDWFVMEDYHVFSSENLTDWKDHGVIVTQTGVEWTNPTAYAMWAPDCVFKDGSAYMYYATAGKGLFVAKLKPNMMEIEGEPLAIDNLPVKGLVEGPFPLERNGIYYLTYPHVENRIERLEYATSASPMGPFKWAGVILDESGSGCWTVHHSLIEWQGQWYLFYHDRDLSPSFDKNRSARADKLFFNADGTIRKVIPTLRGVGLVDAMSQIQIDRYSAKSGEGVAISFLDDANTHAGWKTTFSAAKSWVRFNEVDFGRGAQRSIDVRAKAPAGSTLEIRLDKQDGPVIGRVEVGKGADWKTVTIAARNAPRGVHDLFVTQAAGEVVEVDWISFR